MAWGSRGSTRRKAGDSWLLPLQSQLGAAWPWPPCSCTWQSCSSDAKQQGCPQYDSCAPAQQTAVKSGGHTGLQTTTTELGLHGDS